ncbi:hypothetical protein GCM10009802_01260 [Streptomyces synnematoformans]|uniref:Uncharacterized protein n=1 Tax=Streptomyces synnematoformans TaxID=415721 RepID=A0ABP5IYE7_9ACTN
MGVPDPTRCLVVTVEAILSNSGARPAPSTAARRLPIAAQTAGSSDIRFRTRAGSTGTPGPIVVVMVVFLM